MKHNNEKVKKIAEQIIKSSDLPEEYSSIILIIGMISILLTTIRIIQECNNKKTFSSNNDQVNFYAETIKELSNRRGWYTKMRIKKLIRNEMKREDYRKYGNSLMYAILDYGETISTEECSYLIGE
jgi:hypothetical protein